MKKALPVTLLAAVLVAVWLLAAGTGWLEGDDRSSGAEPTKATKGNAEAVLGLSGPGDAPSSAEPRLSGLGDAPSSAEPLARRHWLHVEVRMKGSGEVQGGIVVRGSWSREFMKQTPGVDGDQTQVTDAAGSVKLGPLPSGSLRLLATADECVAKWESADFDPDASSERDDPRLVLWLAGTASFSGHVYHADGAPAAECVLRAWPSASRDRQSEMCRAKSGSDGSFTLRGLDSDDVYSVRAASGGGSGAAEGWVLARPGEQDVRVVLQARDAPRPARSLVVRVVDGHGVPVPDFQADVRGDIERGAERIQERGLVRCEGVTGPCWVDVWNARSEKDESLPLGPAFAGPFDAAAGEHVIILPREVIYAGRVLDARGNGVAGATLTVHPWSASADRPSEQGALSSGQSGADGSYRLGGLPMGKVRVFVQPPDAFAHRDSFVVVAGTEGAEVTLTRAVAATLRIVGEDDEPLSGVRVCVCIPELDDGFYSSARLLPGFVTRDQADEDGVAVLSGLDASRCYHLRINWERRFWRWDVLAHVNKKWRPADETIRLPKPCSVSGRVLSERGKPVPNALVRLSFGGDVLRESGTGADGTFSFGRLPAGRYTADAWAPGTDAEKPPAATASIHDGDSDVSLTLPTATTAQEGVAADR